jgi:hypothetical protein
MPTDAPGMPEDTRMGAALANGITKTLAAPSLIFFFCNLDLKQMG